MEVILAVDRGNTRTKLGLFSQEGVLLQQQAISDADSARLARSWVEDGGYSLQAVGFLSTGADFDQAEWAAVSSHGRPSFHLIHPGLPWPFAHHYKTPATLGADRFAGIVAACNLAPGQAVLVVDAGTAITYDLASARPEYLGGAISPGITMRYEALHQFTARLPRVTREGEAMPIGDSTINSIRAGVEYAVVREVEGMVDAYRQETGGSLQLFLTGGDAEYFEKQLKKVNFADASLVLRGIYFIIKHIASI